MNKLLKQINKQFDELFNDDNNCSGRDCDHETIDKHWTIYDDDIEALKSFISMTFFDIEKSIRDNTFNIDLPKGFEGLRDSYTFVDANRFKDSLGIKK